ncbi:MAG: hypothetical protein ABI811_23670 [Acidobacteriota bacterium]
MPSSAEILQCSHRFLSIELVMQLTPAHMNSRLVILGPPNANLPGHFKNVVSDPRRHQELIDGVQRLRGNIYVADGAVKPHELSSGGRHVEPADPLAWHIIGIAPDGTPHSCLRHRPQENSARFQDLAVSKSAIANSPEWGAKTKAAVEDDLELARALGVPYLEVGGWAIAPDLRHTSEVLRLTLATYAVWRLMGGALGIGTVTLRHKSASIATRLGGSPLSFNGECLPQYEDPQYGCAMRLLRFSSEEMCPQFVSSVAEMEASLQQTPIILPAPSGAFSARDHKTRANQHTAVS